MLRVGALRLGEEPARSLSLLLNLAQSILRASTLTLSCSGPGMELAGSEPVEKATELKGRVREPRRAAQLSSQRSIDSRLLDFA